MTGTECSRPSSTSPARSTSSVKPTTRKRSLAEDMVRNEQVYHRAIHDWFVEGSAGGDVEQLNERVYRDLFLNPTSDAWLGIVPPDAYRAIDGGGVRLEDGRS